MDLTGIIDGSKWHQKFDYDVMEGWCETSLLTPFVILRNFHELLIIYTITVFLLTVFFSLHPAGSVRG